MQISNQDMTIIKLLSSAEWQSAYKNFAYQNSIHFADNKNLDQQQELFKKFKISLTPIADKFLTKAQQDEQSKNIKSILTDNPHQNVVQLLSLYDFQIFQSEMISQNQLLDLIALELIRKEVKQELKEDSSSEDEEAEREYLEQERQKAKQNIEGKVDLFQKKKELEDTIRETIATFNLPEVLKQPDNLVDEYGFNQGVQNKEDDILKKSIKLRTIKLKQTVPKKEIKLTTTELKKRRLQMDAVKKIIKDI